MPSELVQQIVVQIPLLAIFIWFVLQRDEVNAKRRIEDDAKSMSYTRIVLDVVENNTQALTKFSEIAETTQNGLAEILNDTHHIRDKLDEHDRYARGRK